MVTEHICDWIDGSSGRVAIAISTDVNRDVLVIWLSVAVILS